METITIPENKQTEHFAKDEWIDGFITGTAIAPQSMVSSEFHILSSMLEGEINWEDFSKTELTEEQAKKIGDAMTNMHRGHDIKIASAERSHDDEKKIEPERFQRQWKVEVEQILRVIQEFIWESIRNPVHDVDEGRRLSWHLSGSSKPSDSPDQQAFLAQLFFTNPANSERIQTFKRMVAMGKDLFYQPKGKALVQEYRENLLAGESKDYSIIANHWREQLNSSFPNYPYTIQDFFYRPADPKSTTST